VAECVLSLRGLVAARIFRVPHIVGGLGALLMAAEWLLKRNCSISPRQLLAVYGVLCAASMAVAIFFTLRGAWYVLGFAVLELLAVGLAFLFYARHANDSEKVVLQVDGNLLVELIEAGTARQTRLDSRLITVDMPDMYRGMVRLHCREGLQEGGSIPSAIEVGRFVAQPARRKFARELQVALARQLGRADKQNSNLGF
jgi:uncharacterized membrane protein